MLNRVTVVTIFALLFGLFAVGTASAAQPSDRDPVPPPTTYWQDKGFILMAHQGGEWDFPPNTLFSYKSAMALGADMIDMDAYVTQDGHIVLTHDLQAYKNSEAPNDGNHDINDLTLAQLKGYDFAYKWKPHSANGAADPYPFRGVATGSVPPPNGFTADDFKIPTFDEVLDAFPDTPINIELKEVAGVNIDDTTAKMAEILAAHPGHDENVIINSFGQAMLDSMHAARPEHKSFSGSLNGSLSYVQGNPITPTPVVIEPPDQFDFGAPVGWVHTVPILKPWADHDGYGIFVWGSDHNPDQDTAPFYGELINEGADSYNTPDPIALAAYLCTASIARPDGSPRCAQQICPEGQVGIAPNDCKYSPCPDGTEGVAPDCRPIPCPEGTEGSPPDCTEPVVGPLKMVARPTVKGKKMRINLLCSANYDSCNTATVVVRANGKVRGFKKPLLAKRSGIQVGTGKTKRVYMSLTKTARKIFRDKKFKKNGKKRIKQGPRKVRAGIRINGEEYGVRTVLRIGRVR